MILIKTDNVILNTNLSNEKNSENKSVFSKKSSLSSADLQLSMSDDERISSKNLSKIKQKLDDFYHLNHQDDIDLKNHLKTKSNKIKSKDEKEETDFLNLEGLLLTQRKISSQIFSHVKKVKIEKKSLLDHESKKIPISSNITVESDFKSTKGISISPSDGKKESKLDINELGFLGEKNAVNQKLESVEKKKNIDPNVVEVDNKIKTYKAIKNNEKQVENKQYPYEGKRSFSEGNTAFKIKENASDIHNNIIEKSHYSAYKNNHSSSKKIEKNGLSFDAVRQKLNIDKLDEKKVKEEVNDISMFNNIKPEYQQKIQEPLIDKKLLDIPALSLLYKEVSKMTQPPSITYVFKKWGSELHQMKINFDINKKIELIASTGRVYQSSLDNFNQYQGRLALSLENDNSHWQINAIESFDDKEDEK
ncbi:hypothetical protein QN092_18540 [Proteus vulgaris]|uniref:hypothetical protein n=1 Tax=Proteus vulgaris TaxID=585 RepID=UPI00253F752E|nr:hypothetical protein [Proteus vulgaris]WIF71921.1 hypothetical protein QN092_18540 [Proteus vulgaris]